jgi:DnaJ-class molecular chaperone
VSVPERPQCPDCHVALVYSECDLCKGRGSIDAWEKDDEDSPEPYSWVVLEYECRWCNGDGRRWMCPVCEGAT